MDRCPPSVVARREWTLLVISPPGLPDTLTEALLTTQGLPRGARVLGAPRDDEGAAAVGGDAAGTHSA